jgi:hypothetical protein
MPRKPNETAAQLSDLKARLDQLVASARAQGRAAALDEVRSLVGGTVGAPAAAKRGPGRPKGSTKTATKAARAAKPKAVRKSSWEGLTPEQRLERVNAIRKGRGLKPRDSL